MRSISPSPARRSNGPISRVRPRRRRAWPAATSSTVAQPTRMASCSSTRSTTTRSRWTRRPASCSGRPNWATSTPAKRSPWRGWLTALDLNSGKILWRAYATGPDRDVLIGPGFHSFYPSDNGADLGITTWPGDAWRTGGGTMWGWIAYDPDLNLIYYGTANPGPSNQEQRPGDNKWTTTLFARDPDTGAAKWALQYNPHDEHDYDGINEQILVDMNVDGKPRKVLMHPDRNGHLYVVDRESGEIISAKPYGYVNSVLRIDPKTGRPVMNPD